MNGIVSNLDEKYPGNYFHPTVIVYENVRIGTGNYFGPYCIIGAPPEWKGHEGISGIVSIGDNNRLTGLVTVDSGTNAFTCIQNNCYLMKHSHVGHDATLSNGVTLSCGAKVGGHSIVGSGTTIGLNAVIHQKVSVPGGCMIGANAFVGKKTELNPYRKYAGVPARDIGSNEYHVSDYIINQKQFAGE